MLMTTDRDPRREELHSEGSCFHNWNGLLDTSHHHCYGFLFACNYWDRVIRNTAEHDRIAQYIAENPGKWNGDRFYL